ncbi:MAG TPA: hypothetical protein VHE14_03855, partial [Solirubrobacteraceae bacterium]|nr:hypothetical protein [Solirubrobacteraceae bacterium]
MQTPHPHVARLTRRALALAAALCSLLPAAGAQAQYFPADPIDGPSADIRALGNVALARDGNGGLVYIRREAGSNHIFASFFFGGQFNGPVRIDPGLSGDSSQPVVGAGDMGRTVIVFINGGVLYGVVNPGDGSPVTPPAAIAGNSGAPVLNPALGVSTHGVGYLAFIAPGTGKSEDVHAARLSSDSTTWSVLPGALDFNPLDDAGVGTGRPAITALADGTGLVAFGENGSIFARRIGRTAASTVISRVSLTDLEGHNGGAADQPSVSGQNDASYGYVAFRQLFDDGGTARARTIARRLIGSDFEPPQQLDGLTFPVGEGAARPVLAEDGKGRGLAASSRDSSFIPFGSVLANDAFSPGEQLGALNNGGTFPYATAAVGENDTGFIAWQEDPGGGNLTVKVRDEHKGQFNPEFQISRPEL